VILVILGGISVAATLIAVAVGTEDPASALLTYGPLGVMVVLFIFGWIVPKSTVRQKDEEIARLQRLFTDEVIPMVKTYTETMTRVTENLEQSTKALQVLADIQRAKELG
jgi:hypothetical protein